MEKTIDDFSEYLEKWIAHYNAVGNFQAARALEKVASDRNIPISKNAIKSETERLRKYYNGEENNNDN